ncbi:MAG: GNAT family N-acetyltransferase [Beijerinckiaceae bacterium]
MAATEFAVEIETLEIADAPAGLALSDEAGWNQTIEDWSYFLEQGTVFGMRDTDGTVIATAALLPSPPLTWISMVLVTQSQRRRGVANTLMKRCIAEAQKRGLEPWLDATPAGASVYKPMGFAETGIGLLRIRRTTEVLSSAIPSRTSPESIRRLLEADRRAMGFDRSKLLEHFAGRDGSIIYATGDALALVRTGRKARHIGPVYATSEASAIGLLDAVLRSESGSLVVDLSSAQTPVRDVLLSRGFVLERPFSRMRLGGEARRASGGGPEFVAVAGPEFG